MIMKFFQQAKKIKQQAKIINAYETRLERYEAEIVSLTRILHAKEKKYARWERALEVIIHSTMNEKWWQTTSGQSYAVALMALEGYEAAVRKEIRKVEPKDKEHLRKILLHIEQSIKNNRSLKFKVHIGKRYEPKEFR